MRLELVLCFSIYYDSPNIDLFWWFNRVDAGSDIKKPTQILSTLFPQTSPTTDVEEKAREQKKKEEDDEKQEREKSWKRMKLG